MSDYICPGVPTTEARAQAERMVDEAWERAADGCLGAHGPCINCASGELLKLAVFAPVLFPEETQ